MCIRDSLDAYYDTKIYENDPFAKLDQVGVGKLMEMAVKLGKSTRPTLHLSLIHIFHRAARGLAPPKTSIFFREIPCSLYSE